MDGVRFLVVVFFPAVFVAGALVLEDEFVVRLVFAAVVVFCATGFAVGFEGRFSVSTNCLGVATVTCFSVVELVFVFGLDFFTELGLAVLFELDVLTGVDLVVLVAELAFEAVWDFTVDDFLVVRGAPGFFDDELGLTACEVDLLETALAERAGASTVGFLAV